MLELCGYFLHKVFRSARIPPQRTPRRYLLYSNPAALPLGLLLTGAPPPQICIMLGAPPAGAPPDTSSSASPLSEAQEGQLALSDLPEDVVLEIATRVLLSSFRRVFRFDVHDVAARKLQRFFRAFKARGRLGGTGLSVGSRVLVRSTASSRMQYATVAASVDGPQPKWKVQLLSGVYVQVHASRLCRLSDWANGPWADTVGRQSALASASSARSEATKAAAAAAALMRSGVSDMHTALAFAAATAASTAAAAATAASSAAAPAAANDSREAREAQDLLVEAQKMQEALTARGPSSSMAGPALPISGEESARLLEEVAKSARKAAAEAAAATSAAEAVAAVGALPVTTSTAAAATAVASQVATAVQVETRERVPTEEPDATAQAADVAASALADIGVAGRALRSCLGGATSAGQSAALEAVQLAAKLLEGSATGSDVAELAAAPGQSSQGKASGVRLAKPEAGGSRNCAGANASTGAAAAEPCFVAMPDREAVVEFLCRMNQTQYGPSDDDVAAGHPQPTAAQTTARNDAVHGIIMQMSHAAQNSVDGLLPADACPLLWSNEDPRNVWALEGRMYATQRTVDLPLVGAAVTIEQRWMDHREEVEIEGHPTAAVAWDGGVVLADFLCLPPPVLLSHSPKLARSLRAYATWRWADKTVVELGCGIAALPSLSAGLLGAARVVSTDGNPGVLLKTRANVAGWLNSHPHAIAPTVAELQWGAGEQVRESLRALGVSKPVDVVLAADCIYVLENPGAWGKLLATIEALAGEHTLAFVTYTDRGHDKLWRRFLDERVSQCFHVVQVASHLLHPIAQPGAVGRLEQLTPQVQVFCWTLRVSAGE